MKPVLNKPSRKRAAKKKIIPKKRKIPRPKVPWEKVARWYMSRETGGSAQFLLDVGFQLEGSAQGGHREVCIPHDKGDFGRCLRLLKVIPELGPYLKVVAERYPAKWGGFIKEWHALQKACEDKSVTYDAFRAMLGSAQDEFAEKQKLEKDYSDACNFLEEMLHEFRKHQLTGHQVELAEEAERFLDETTSFRSG